MSRDPIPFYMRSIVTFIVIQLNETQQDGLYTVSHPIGSTDLKDDLMQQVSIGSSRLNVEVKENPFLSGAVVIDAELPEWARRSNPIVKRHLGTAWKTFLPNPGLLIRLYVLQVVVVMASAAFPVLLTLLMPTVMVSLVLIPAGLVLYAQILYSAGAAAATYMVDERRNDTLELTLVIPQPTRFIIFSKVSAALWRHLENLMLMSLAVVLFSMPLMIVQYDIQFSLNASPALVRIGLLIGLAVSLIRLWIEPVMIASIGVAYGAASHSRVQAITATMLTGAAYFVAVNLARLLPLEGINRLLVETALPVALPILITAVALRLSAMFLRQD